ncbi:hypothetical protein LBMAG53_08210 [Planctomycetota bacterium]|nr:hypothetical protein LBMAG53_08210 [Planctomycetota bacterium]
MLLAIERVALLRGANGFANADPETLVAISACCEEMSVAAGANLFEKGHRSSSMSIIARGRVRVFDGAVTRAVLGPGQALGKLTVLVPDEQLATAEAVEDTILLRLEHAALFDLMRDRAEVAHAIIHALVARIRTGEIADG